MMIITNKSIKKIIIEKIEIINNGYLYLKRKRADV